VITEQRERGGLPAMAVKEEPTVAQD
jgi:hypothetical protein